MQQNVWCRRLAASGEMMVIIVPPRIGREEGQPEVLGLEEKAEI